MLITFAKNINKNKYIKNFKYREDDIILVSYPKSGTTWLRFLISNIIKKNTEYYNREIDFVVCNKIFPGIDKIGKEYSNPEYLSSPRFLSSHSAYTLYFKNNLIYLLRDGRDAMVSYYFFNKKFYNMDCSFLEFLKQGNPKNWYKHVTSWLAKDINLYFIKYEDLLDDTETVLKNLLNYFKIEYTEEELINAVKSSSFHNMKKIEEEKGFEIVERGNSEINFIRKGQKGDWKEYFGEEEKAVFKKQCGCLLNFLGYEKGTDW